MRQQVHEALQAASELGDKHAKELTEFVDGVTELQPNEAMLILGTYMNRIQQGLHIDALSAQTAVDAMADLGEQIGRAHV